MFGLIRFQNRGIVAKSGFKYIRLDPSMTFFSERNEVAYNNKFYAFNGNRLYIEFDDYDIVKETMLVIDLKSCRPLNLIAKSGVSGSNIGYRTLVFNQDMTKLAPIVNRIIHGDHEQRHDLFAYSEDNYVKLTYKWNRRFGKWIVESSNKYSDIDEHIQKLKDKYPQLYEFITKISMDSSNIHAPVINQLDANKEHLERFSRQYSTLCKTAINIDPYNYRSLDIIDIDHINCIRLNDPTVLDMSPVVDFRTNRVIHKGNGITDTHFDDQVNDDKFLYMIIPNCHHHRIHVQNRESTLALETVQYDDGEYPIPHSIDLVMIKFNKYSVKRFDENITVETTNN